MITGNATYMFAFGSLRPQNLEFSLNNPDLVHLGVAADPYFTLTVEAGLKRPIRRAYHYLHYLKL